MSPKETCGNVSTTFLVVKIVGNNVSASRGSRLGTHYCKEQQSSTSNNDLDVESTWR